MSRALGRYELLRPLARGGMAEVYLARRKAAGVEKWLVVKRIRAQLSGDVRFLDLFVREARLSMSLTHQNIVPVFDFGRIDDQVFLAMERVEGKDLGSSLVRAGERRLPPLVAAFIAAECCQALDYAHRRKSPEGTALGIVHRDVTPRNVLLSWSGEVKLTDFGIAALAGDATTKLIGTPAYMAPEQARGEPLDARADVYALGLVLRELLTGDRARPGGERDATLAAAKTGELVPWPTGVPPALVAIVDRATSPAAEARFADARAMLQALDDFSVAERAANKGDAPARQLAAWLDEVWGTERDDDSIDGEVKGNHLVSFLDDGALDVIGTGTERSMAATAAGDDVPLPLPEVQDPPPPPPAKMPRQARIALGVFAIIVAIGALGIYALEGSGTETRPDAAVVAVTPERPVDAGPMPVAEVPIDAPVDAPVVIDAGIKVRTPPKQAPDAGVAQVVPPPAVVKRKVTINATPWANFTVDGDPTSHETIKTIQLAPGPHTIHFDNPVLGIKRDVVIEVPADRDISHVERLRN
jgi:serine/threonine-protein kinase